MATILRRLFCILALFLLGTSPAFATPKVLATIKPVHSLVAAVMAGAGTPDLLIGGALSAHSYALKPSDARKLAAAQVIFEVGPDMETYLAGSFAALRAKVIALENVPGVVRLPARNGGLWADEHDGRHGNEDPHVWLDPHNAIAMTKAIATVLCQIDPAHAALYRRNAERRVGELGALDRELAAMLAPVKARPYLVFHDAYHYFEARYGLKAAGAVTVSPDRPVGGRRVAELRRSVLRGGAQCLFAEPQFPPKLIRVLEEGSGIQTGVLDPLGADLQPGADLYPRLMRSLAQSLSRCLTKKR